jgi:hypothetical protein
MKGKILNLLLILTSLIGYLEWGKDNTAFLFQVEAGILSKIFTDPISVIHPFTILPLAGQLLLFFTLFQKEANKILTLTGMAGLGILLALMFFIGCISLNLKILASTIPFLVVGYLTIRNYRKINSSTGKAEPLTSD